MSDIVYEEAETVDKFPRVTLFGDLKDSLVSFVVLLNSDVKYCISNNNFKLTKEDNSFKLSSNIAIKQSNNVNLPGYRMTELLPINLLDSVGELKEYLSVIDYYIENGVVINDVSFDNFIKEDGIIKLSEFNGITLDNFAYHEKLMEDRLKKAVKKQNAFINTQIDNLDEGDNFIDTFERQMEVTHFFNLVKPKKRIVGKALLFVNETLNTRKSRTHRAILLRTFAITQNLLELLYSTVGHDSNLSNQLYYDVVTKAYCLALLCHDKKLLPLINKLNNLKLTSFTNYEDVINSIEEEDIRAVPMCCFPENYKEFLVGGQPMRDYLKLDQTD